MKTRIKDIIVYLNHAESLLQIRNPLTSQHKGLIIGCGTNFDGRNNCINHCELHPLRDFYTLDLCESIEPDIVGDIRNTNVLTYLYQHKFNLVCIECVPALLFANPKIDEFINSLFRLLDKNGVLILLSCGNLLDYEEVYKPLLAEVESFRIYSLYRDRDKFPFPVCTIVAGINSEMNAFQKRYLEKAMRDKNICNSEKATLECKTVERQPAYRLRA